MPSGIRRRKLAKSGFNLNIKRKARREKKKKYLYGSSVIEANWDPKLTVVQNYRKLGLASNLQRATGGVEDTSQRSDIFTVSKAIETARIVQNGDGSTQIEYQSNDEHDIDAPIRQVEGKTDVVRQLEAEAKNRTKTERYQSEEETKWLSKLIAKYDDDYEAMQWDKKLNQFQHSAGDLKRRIKQYRSNAAQKP